jgi:uncharacterized membrane protein YqgA involved in biofilm formation
MEHTLWEMTSGTWINAAGVLAGTAVGAIVRSRLSSTTLRTMQQAVGLVTLVIGAQMALRLSQVQAGAFDGVSLALLALAVGVIIGEGLRIEERLISLSALATGRWATSTRLSEAVITPFLLFCIGPLTLLGSITNGLTGDASLLLVKTVLDGIASVALACSLGPVVGLSIIPLVVLQAGLSLGAGGLGEWVVGEPAQQPPFVLAVGVGGVLLLGLGLQLLEVAQVRVAALLPALVLAPVSYLLLSNFLAS